MRWTNWVLLAATGISSASALGRDIIMRTERVSPGWVLVADDRTTSAPEQNARGYVANAPHPRQKGTYLGVSASPAPTVIRKQLALPEGMGLVVDIVVPNSPAAEAGLREFDVMQKLDDQLLVNPEQLAVLVRSHKPGEEIKLTVFREGRLTTLTAKLTEHEIEPIRGEMPDWLRTNPNNSELQWFQFGGPNTRLSANSLTWIDGDRDYTLSTDAQHHQKFTVKNKAGDVVFDGNIDTEKERESLPADLRQKLDHLKLDLSGSLDKPRTDAPAK
jgi:hypothetical protein